ncbi:MAG: Ig-like domain-containing protein [Candidatus Poribacteria bacterium]|nr:Ig-like domain-containing protein [Candidatus Poribacteria bacterium]
MKYIDFNPIIYVTSLMVIVIMLGIIGCGDDENGIYKPPERNAPRVIAVNPTPGAQRTEAVNLSKLGFPTQEFRITFNEPIIPNSGRILFGTSPYIATIQLQETEATDTITWNQCYRAFFLDNIGSMVIRDFQNVNGDVQPHPYVGWYRMPDVDLGPPTILEYYPIGQDVDPKTTRFIRVVSNRPVEMVFCEITPEITLSPAHIENDSIKSCTGAVTWDFVGTEQLDYSTKYDVKIGVDDFGGIPALENYSFTTRAAPR